MPKDEYFVDNHNSADEYYKIIFEMLAFYESHIKENINILKSSMPVDSRKSDKVENKLSNYGVELENIKEFKECINELYYDIKNQFYSFRNDIVKKLACVQDIIGEKEQSHFNELIISCLRNGSDKLLDQLHSKTREAERILNRTNLRKQSFIIRGHIFNIPSLLEKTESCRRHELREKASYLDYYGPSLVAYDSSYYNKYNDIIGYVEKAEDKVFKNYPSLSAIKNNRQRINSSLWSRMITSKQIDLIRDVLYDLDNENLKVFDTTQIKEYLTKLQSKLMIINGKDKEELSKYDFRTAEQYANPYMEELNRLHRNEELRRYAYLLYEHQKTLKEYPDYNSRIERENAKISEIESKYNFTDEERKQANFKAKEYMNDYLERIKERNERETQNNNRDYQTNNNHSSHNDVTPFDDHTTDYSIQQQNLDFLQDTLDQGNTFGL